MGWYVISFVNIECAQTLAHEDIEQIKTFLKGIEHGDFQAQNDTCSFMLGGNKGIDYACLDSIKEYLKGKNYRFSIAAEEFAECGSGYYFETDSHEKIPENG